MSEERILNEDEDADRREDEIDVDKLTTDELLALARAAESRVNVFSQLNRTDPDRHGDQLSEAQGDLQKYADALKEHNYSISGTMLDPTKTVPDKEGTAPTLADAEGAYAENAVVANIGGVGINTSNADPDGAMAELERRAKEGGDVGYDPRGSSPLMRRDTSIEARREREEAAGDKGSGRVPLEREPA